MKKKPVNYMMKSKKYGRIITAGMIIHTKQ